MTYSHLADAHLVYVTEMDPVVDPGSVPGHLLGSGTGTIAGPRLKGGLRWSFFEEDCAWDPGLLVAEEHPPGNSGRSVCRTYPRGIIETEDGALIQFEGQGFALRQEGDPIWTVGSTVRFVTEADPYRWLTEALAAYYGQFDGQTGTATWSFNIPGALNSR